MELGLRGKVVLVTGASRGIGRAIAEAFAQEGCRLCMCARGQEALAHTAEALRHSGAEVLPIAADVTRSDDVDQLVKAIEERLGRIDVLVNNVGGAAGDGIVESSIAAWQQGLDLTLLSSVRVSRRVVPLMLRHGGGAIIMNACVYRPEAGGR